jgi:uncharacterized protein (TIGR02271 family)
MASVTQDESSAKPEVASADDAAALTDQTGHITVLDNEGVRGAVATHAMQHTGDPVLITFDQNRQVQVPSAVLRRRADGSYFLPFSFRDLGSGAVTLEGTDDGGVVAVIPVIAEEPHVAKRQVETGRLRISKTVQTVEEQVAVPLTRDRAQVERVPVNRYLEEPATPHYRGDTLVIPVMEEVIVVEKRLLLREEIHVTNVREQVQHEETITLRREQATVERQEAGPDDPAAHPHTPTTHQDSAHPTE